MDRIGAAVWATGHAGRVIVEAGLTRPWLEFRGGIVYDPAKDGLDLGEACGLDVRLGAPVSTDVDAVLGRPDIDVVFYTGIGSPTDVADACLRANRAGKDAITISGLVHPKTVLGATAAAELDAAARAAGGRILGTGLWDYLTITLPLASLSNVLRFDEIRLERVADMSLWGHGILRDEGIGGPIEAAGGGFMMRNFLVEALMLLAESAGLDVDEPTFESTPVLTEVRRERNGYVAEPGTIGGHDRRAAAEHPRRRTARVGVARALRPAAGARRHGGIRQGHRRRRPAVRDDRSGRPLPRHVPADRGPGDGRGASPPAAATGAAHDRRAVPATDLRVAVSSFAGPRVRLR